MTEIQMKFPDPKPTHEISFKVTTKGPEEWNAVYGAMTRMAAQWGPYHVKVGVSSVLLDEDVVSGFPGEYHDENTVQVVKAALGKSGLSVREVEDAFREMQNAGILFRQRV
jgi:hypothetical protein